MSDLTFGSATQDNLSGSATSEGTVSPEAVSTTPEDETTQGVEPTVTPLESSQGDPKSQFDQNPDEVAAERASEEPKDTEFFNIHDGSKGRLDGRYLDVDERIQAEKARAIAEGREPQLDDLGALPASVGTPLVVESQLSHTPNSNPAIDTVEAFGLTKTVDPVSTLPVDRGSDPSEVDLSYAAQVARERQASEDALTGAAADNTVLTPEGTS